HRPPADGPAWVLGILGIAIGGSIGAVIARRVPMTSMPELVAAFHSLVGMAAGLVAAAAFYAPPAFDIGTVGNIHKSSLVEMSIGVAIGALTFTGSVFGFLKLSGRYRAQAYLVAGTPRHHPLACRGAPLLHLRFGRLAKPDGFLAGGSDRAHARRAHHR